MRAADAVRTLLHAGDCLTTFPVGSALAPVIHRKTDNNAVWLRISSMSINLRTGRTDAGPAGGPSGQAPNTPSGRSLLTRIGEHRIHSVEYGEGDRVLLLLHGLSGSTRWWARNVPELCTDRRVIVPDLIGFGRSRPLRVVPSIGEIASLLLDWLATIGVDPVSVVGHSMGGQISIHLAAKAPERIERLVLVDSSGIPRAISPRTLLRFAAEAGPLWRWGDPSFLPVIAGDALTAGPRVLARAIQNLLADDVRPLLPSIQAPTLVLWGERDALVPLADAFELRERIPDARLAVLRGAAHNPMVDRPADFNRVVRRFLDGELVGR